jgi:hypothetical protein
MRKDEMNVMLIYLCCELYVSLGVGWATLVFPVICSPFWIYRAVSPLNSSNLICFQFLHDIFQMVIECFVEPRFDQQWF